MCVYVCVCVCMCVCVCVHVSDSIYMCVCVRVIELMLTPKTSQVNVWIGEPHVAAHLHYGVRVLCVCVCNVCVWGDVCCMCMCAPFV